MNKKNHKLNFLDEDNDSSENSCDEPNVPSFDQKLHYLVPQKSYEALCRRIQKEVSNNYQTNVVQHFPSLTENRKLINKEFSPKQDSLDQKWRLQIDQDVSNQKLEYVCQRLQFKLENIQDEIQQLHEQQNKNKDRLEILKKQNQYDIQILN